MFMSVTEIIAVVSSLICVYFTLKNNIWCWPFGLVGVIAYGFVFYDVKLYSDVILQCIYVVLQFVGWYAWLRGGKDKNKLPVTNLSGMAKAGWVALALLGSALWGHLMATNTDAAAPYPDAFIVVASLIAQWLLCVKKAQAWIFWIVVDVVAIGVYYYKDLYLTSGLYAVFLVMATMGYFEWRKLSQQSA